MIERCVVCDDKLPNQYAGGPCCGGVVCLRDVKRDMAGETVCGFRVAAWRETHPEHGDKYGHKYSEHWSTPNYRDHRVKVERLFTETQLREALNQSCPK